MAGKLLFFFQIDAFLKSKPTREEESAFPLVTSDKIRR